MKYLITLYALGIVSSNIYYDYLALDIQKLISGQIWRVFTWLIYPISNNMIFAFIMLLVYYNLGTTLEMIWGSFRFNVFMFMGIIFHVIAAFLMYFIFKQNVYISPNELNLSIFLAFALTFPQAEFRLYFVLPIKAKVLAFFYIIIEIFNFINGSIEVKLTIFLCMLNFIIFFFISGNFKNKFNFIQRKVQAKSRNDFIKIRANKARYTCYICKKTSDEYKDLEFRYCSKCSKNLAYCSEHIFTHKHIIED